MIARFFKRLMVVIVLGIGVALGISAVGFTLRQHDRFSSTTEVDKLESAFIEVQGSLSIDQKRQAVIDRITGLIEKYNKEMPSETRYRIAREIYRMEIKYENLNVDLICATITHESANTWDPKIVSPAGAMGLMQIMPRTGEYLATYESLAWTSSEEILFNPINNIRMGCNYMSMLIDFYGVEGALAAYNGGEKRAAKWLASNKAEGILWKETQNYVPAVLELYQRFKN